MNRKSSYSKDRRYRFDKGVCLGSGLAPAGHVAGSLYACCDCSRYVKVRKDGTTVKHLRVVQQVDMHTGQVFAVGGLS